jgi:hypothetical protein
MKTVSTYTHHDGRRVDLLQDDRAYWVIITPVYGSIIRHPYLTASSAKAAFKAAVRGC